MRQVGSLMSQEEGRAARRGSESGDSEPENKAFNNLLQPLSLPVPTSISPEIVTSLFMLVGPIVKTDRSKHLLNDWQTRHLSPLL